MQLYQVRKYCGLLFHYNTDEMPQEPKSCLYWSAYGKISFVMGRFS